MGVQVFSVLTEFKFDVTQAVAGSDALQKSTQKLSEAADEALVSVKSLGMGLVSALGVGGVLGVFEKAVHASDQFQSSVLDFTAVISSNMNVLQGSVGTFNDRLSVGKQIMGEIAAEADKLNLDQGEMFQMVKTLTPAFAQQGMAGTNFRNVTAISGSATGAAPGLGLSQSEMASQISAILAGTASQGALVNRLQATKAMKGTSLDQLNSSEVQERFKLLSEGLKEISMDMGDVAERANLLSTQMKKLKTLILGDEHGMGSIFKPLGDAIRPLLVGVMKDINGYVKNQGAQIAGNFAQLLKSFISTPKEMLVSILQLKQAHSDLNKAAHTLGFVGAIEGIGLVLSKVTGIALFANPILGIFGFAISMISDIFARCNDPVSRFVGHFMKWGILLGSIASILAKFGVLWPVLSFAMSEVLIPLGLLFIMFQAISRAVAKAHVEDALHLAEIMPKVTELFTRVKMALHNIILPVELAIDGLSDILKPLFKWSIWIDATMPLIEGFANVLEMLGTVIVDTLATISGVFSSFFQILLNFQEKGVLHVFDNLGKAFNEGFDDFIHAHKQKMDEGKNVQNMVTNISKVEIRNDFKENMEPDRIAFTLKDQLLKAAQNPTQARGRSLQTGFASR